MRQKQERMRYQSAGDQSSDPSVNAPMDSRQTTTRAGGVVEKKNLLLNCCPIAEMMPPFFLLITHHLPYSSPLACLVPLLSRYWQHPASKKLSIKPSLSIFSSIEDHNRIHLHQLQDH